MKVISKSFTAVLMLLVSFVAAGQQNETGVIRGYFNVGAGDEKPYGGVFSYISQSDTVNTIVLTSETVLKGCRPGKGKVVFSHISYEHFERDVQVSADSVTVVVLDLKPRATETLEAAGVTAGRIPRITFVGDTIRYNAAALDLMEGEPALEILRNMPGVVIDDTGIAILSENVSRTYVDGSMLFGKDVMTALANLPASDVISIDTYKELNPFGKNSRFDKKKERVLNIRTKSRLIQAAGANIYLSGGADIAAPHQFRYGAGANANFFSKDLVLGLNANSNNINVKSNKEGKFTPSFISSDSDDSLNYSDASIDKRWGSDEYTDAIEIGAGYAFNNCKSVAHSSVSQKYLDNDLSTGRADHISDTSASHLANAHLSIIKRSFMISLDNSVEWEENSAYQSFMQEHDMAGNRSSSCTVNMNRESTFALSQSLAFNLFRDRSYHTVNADWRILKGNGGGDRSDSFDIDTPFMDFIHDNCSDESAVNIRYVFGKSIGMNSNLSVGYTLRYEKMRREKASVDVSSPAAHVVDLTNSYDYSENHIRNEPEISFSCASSDCSNRFTARLRMQHAVAERTDIMPVFPAFRKQLLYPLVSAQYDMDFGVNSIMLSYYSNLKLPSSEQWRPQPVCSSPLLCVSGNADLRPEYSHVLYARTNLVGEYGNSFSFHGAVTCSEDIITLSTRYIDSPEYMPEWKYTLQQGASLSQWVNSGNALQCVVGCDIELGIKRLKANARISPMYSFSRMPYVFNGQPVKMDNNRFELGARLNTLVSRRFSYRLALNAGYIQSSEIGRPGNNSFTTAVDAACQWYLLENVYLKPFYRFTGVANSVGLPASHSDNLLNVVAGVSLFKRKMDISVSAYDILGSNTHFISRVVQNYVESKFMTGLSRFVMLNVSYKFYHSKSGLESPSASMKLNDGRFRSF